ncbi:hypothetical protein [uncultured Prevotella sp.]|uniref:hypothetical protein n=1 Tax=uncultured Prevotella sp. TaxID=159272 RepID=UPI00260BCB01|nr:hypothetical protein [uncultured Prevotella sp.]
MAKLYLFAIGGTGSRVLRSLTMMMAAGVKMDVDEVVPIIIDPDASNQNLTDTVQLMNEYRETRKDLSFPQGVETQFFRTELSQILPNYTLRIQNTNNKKFKQFIDYSSVQSTSTKAMLKMLFSEKNLDSSMDVGFKGNPNIGSVVLNQIVASGDFTEFANNFSAGDKIFIISSIFGGTGASGFPLLLKTLRTNTVMPNNELINNAEIGAITMLPYFKLAQSTESEIDSSTFISKTKSALAYYENNIIENNSINALYYLADDVTNTYDNNEGGSKQRNDAHLIEFLAATAVADFCNNSYQSGATVNKELGIKDIKGGVTFSSFDDSLQKLLFAPLTEYILMTNCLTRKESYYSSKSFNANNDNFKDLYNSSFFTVLKSMCFSYLKWLEEMKNNKRSLDLFDLSSADKPFDVVTGRKPKKIFSTKSDYDLVTDRLNSAAKHCNSKSDNDKFLEMFFLGTQKLLKEKFNA